MASPVLQFKRGIAANVGLASFKAGEPGFTTDKYDFYIGLDATAANQKFFGSARYWTREVSGTTAAILKLVDNAGSNSINLKSADTLSGVTTYTFPSTPTAGNFLTVDANGNLSWASVSSSGSFSNTTLSGVTTISGTLNNTANTTNSGVTTFSGSVNATGNVTLGDAAGDTITVNGTTTFTQPVTGTISTATRATLVDTTTAATNTYYPGLFVNSTGTASTAVYVDSGISYASGTDTLTLTGNLAVNGGSVTSTSGVATVFNANSTTVNAFGAATTLNMGANSGTLTVGNPTVVGTQGTQNLYNTTATNLNFGGAATALNMGATTGIATINNPTLVGTQATQNLYNTVATTLNFGGAATALNMGANTGTLTVGNPTVVGTQATQNLYNTTATTLNFGGAATSLNMGANSGTLTVGNPTVVGTQATQNLYNTTATILNFGGAATALNMGATTGIATINNATLTLPNATTVNVNGASPTFASSSTGTLTFFNTNLTAVNAFGAATNILLGASTGVTTVRNSLRVTNALYDTNNSAGTTGQLLASTQTGIGWTTVLSASLTGTISTATRATTVDTTTAPSGTYYPGFFSSSTGATGTSVYVDSGISYVSNTDTLTATNLTVTGTLTGTASTATLSTRSNTVDTTTAPSGTFYPGFFVSGTGVAGTSVYVDTGISYVSNTDTLTATNLTVTGTLTGTATTATRATLVDTTTAPSGTFYPGFFVNSTGTASTAVYVDSGISYVSNTDTLTATNLTVTGTLTGTATTATKLNTNNGSAVSGYIPFVTNGTATNGETFYVDTAIQYNGSTDTLTVNNAQHSAVKALDGTSAITITSITGAVGLTSDLTVGGNLYVNGSSTIVNTSELQVYDRTITLGIQSGTTPSTTTWDLGVMMNYGDAGVAKTAGVIWESANKRFQFATSANNPSVGIDTGNPQITVATFAPIEISDLYINNTCTGGSKAVITCSGSTLILQDITIDAGSF